MIKPLPKTYEKLDARADSDPETETVQLGEIIADAREIHPFLPKWTYWPDYERVSERSSIQYYAFSRGFGRFVARCGLAFPSAVAYRR